MLHHLNSNLSNVQSLKSFQHLSHQTEHPNLDLHILTFPKNSLISTVSTPKNSLTVFLGGCCLQVQQSYSQIISSRMSDLGSSLIEVAY